MVAITRFFQYTERMRDDIKGVAFDLDGTLYPNHRLYLRLIPYILKERRLLSAFRKVRKIIRGEQRTSNIDQEDFYRYQAEITAKFLSGSSKKLSSEQVKEKIELLIYRGFEPIFKNIKLFKGVSETLKALRAAGYKLGLLSDFPPEKKIEYLGLNGFFDVMHCSESCGALKPHPMSFKILAQAMSLPCEKILYVGNSRPYDVAGASAAGMKTAWIKNPLFPGNGLKEPKPGFSFHNYRQLHNYMID